MKTVSEKDSKMWFARVVVAALLLATIMAACGPQPTPVAPTATSVPPTQVPPTTAPPTPVPPTSAPTAGLPNTAPTAAATAHVDPAYYPNEPVSVVPAGVPGQPMITAAYNTVIRGGPGTNYVVYGAFLGSATAQAVGISSDSQWFVISVPVAPNGIGWVSAAYSIPANTSGLPVLQSPPVPPTVDLVAPGPNDPQATALTEVYVRTGPGQTYPAYAIAKTGQMARVLGKSQDAQWLVVRTNPSGMIAAGYAWVALAYVQAVNIQSVPIVAAPPQSPVVEVPPPASGVPSATANDYVNIRSGPGNDYLIVGVASPGMTGEVTGKSQDGAWWQVKIPTFYWSTGSGWVSADWVTTHNTDSVPVATAEAPPPTQAPNPTTQPATNQCTLVAQNPPDNTVFPPNYGFGVSWTLKNTGTTTWDPNVADIIFQGAINGERLHQGGDVFDLPQTVAPGQTITINGSLITRPNPGQYGEAWAIQGGGQTFCKFWIVIVVQ